MLSIDADYVVAHERLKDIFIAADRRVDAVKELLWLSNACDTHSRERAIEHAQSAYELAPRSDATRRRLMALGVLPDGAEAGRAARVEPVETVESFAAPESIEPGIEPTLAGETAPRCSAADHLRVSMRLAAPRRSAFSQAQPPTFSSAASPYDFRSSRPLPPLDADPFASTEFRAARPPPRARGRGGALHRSARAGWTHVPCPRPPPEPRPTPDARASTHEGALPPPPAFRPAPPLARPSLPMTGQSDVPEDAHDATMPGTELPASLRGAPAPQRARSEPPPPSIAPLTSKPRSAPSEPSVDRAREHRDVLPSGFFAPRHVPSAELVQGTT